MNIADCTCYHDCRTCPQSGDFHQHSDEPCPVHSGVVDETGGEPLSANLQTWHDGQQRDAVDQSYREYLAQR